MACCLGTRGTTPCPIGERPMDPGVQPLTFGGALDQVLLVKHEDHLADPQQGPFLELGSTCHEPGQASSLTASSSEVLANEAM